jgi:hypothetical protein
LKGFIDDPRLVDIGKKVFFEAETRGDYPSFVERVKAHSRTIVACLLVRIFAQCSRLFIADFSSQQDGCGFISGCTDSGGSLVDVGSFQAVAGKRECQIHNGSVNRQRNVQKGNCFAQRLDNRFLL